MIALVPVAQAKLEMLTPAQRDLLYLSGVFAPHTPFEVTALLTLWQGSVVTQAQLADLLPHIQGLVPHFFTQTEDGWYKHTDLQTHAYALEILTRMGEAAEAHQEHLRYYQDHSEQWSATHPHLADEVAQYNHAIQWAQLKGYEFLLALALTGCQQLAFIEGYTQQVRAWMDVILNVAAAHGDSWGLAAQFRTLGDIALRIQAFAIARAFYYHALARWGESGLAGQAHTFKSLGDLSLAEKQYENGKGFYHKALVLYEVVGFTLGQANTLKQLAWVCAQMKDRQAATENYTRAAKLYAKMNLSAQQAASLKDLADLHLQAGQVQKAQDHYQQALGLYKEVEFWDDQAQVHLAIGHAYRQADDPHTAHNHYEQALPLYQQGGLREGQAKALRAIGDNHRLQKNYPQAESAFRQAHDLYQQLGDSASTAQLQILLVALALDQGHQEQAITLIKQVLPAIEQLPDLLTQHELKRQLGQLLAPLGDSLPTLYGPDMPDWLRPSPIHADTLKQALESPQSLQQALEADSAALLHRAAQLDGEGRLGWLTQALALCANDSSDADIHIWRAVLLRELAGLPGREVSPTLHAAIAAYDQALKRQKEDALTYGRTQNRRVALLRDMAGMRGENRRGLLYQALAGSDEAVAHLKGRADYPPTLFHRANLLRELAGLKGEDRANWMLQALTVYDEVLGLDSSTPLERATTQTNRASLLQEIALLPEEDYAARLKMALAASVDALQITQSGTEDVQAYRRVAERMLSNVRRMVIDSLDPTLFDAWWEETAHIPQPDWTTL